MGGETTTLSRQPGDRPDARRNGPVAGFGIVSGRQGPPGPASGQNTALAVNPTFSELASTEVARWVDVVVELFATAGPSRSTR